MNESTSDNDDALVVDVDKLETVKDFGSITFDHFNVYNEEKKIKFIVALL